MISNETLKQGKESCFTTGRVLGKVNFLAASPAVASNGQPSLLSKVLNQIGLRNTPGGLLSAEFV